MLVAEQSAFHPLLSALVRVPEDVGAAPIDVALDSTTSRRATHGAQVLPGRCVPRPRPFRAQRAPMRSVAGGKAMPSGASVSSVARTT